MPIHGKKKGNRPYFCDMITIYGISNCDTMQKAIKWLEGNNIAFQYHNYKTAGIDKATIGAWLKRLPLEKVINTNGTTYKKLTDDEKAALSDKRRAATVMIANPSVIRRPLWDFGNGTYYAGWKEEEVKALVK